MTRKFLRLGASLLTLSLLTAPALAQKGGGGGPNLELELQPSELVDFGTVSADGIPAQASVVLHNGTPSTVNVDIPSSIHGFTFISGSGTYTLASGANVTLQISYTATLEGIDIVQLHPSPDSDLILGLKANAIRDEDCGAIEAEVDFGPVTIGTPATFSVFVSNDTGASKDMRLAGACNAYTNLSAPIITVPDGQTGSFNVEVDPQYEGEYVGQYTAECGSSLWLRATGVSGSSKMGFTPVKGAAGDGLSMLAAPNPVRAKTTIRYALAGNAALSGTLRILDARGRLVRLESISIEPGAHEWIWDRRDASGQTVASGVYFAEIEAAGAVARQKLTVLR